MHTLHSFTLYMNTQKIGFFLVYSIFRFSLYLHTTNKKKYSSSSVLSETVFVHIFPTSNENENERRNLITDTLTKIVIEMIKMTSHYIKTPTVIRAYVVYFNFWTIRYSYSEIANQGSLSQPCEISIYTPNYTNILWWSSLIILYLFRNTCFTVHKCALGCSDFDFFSHFEV